MAVRQASFIVSLKVAVVSTTVPPGAVALIVYSVSAVTSAAALDATFSSHEPLTIAAVMYEGAAWLLLLSG